MPRQVSRLPRSVRALVALTVMSTVLGIAGGPGTLAFAMPRPLQTAFAANAGDVQPSDEAFVALVDLVNRYGCISGYPDATTKWTKSVTRYEFAAALSACLERIGPGVAATSPSSPDRVTLARLQESFAAELATLRGRVDSLEARTAALEVLQFSPTNKLGGPATIAALIPKSTKKRKTTVRPTTTKGKARVARTTVPTSTKPAS